MITDEHYLFPAEALLIVIGISELQKNFEKSNHINYINFSSN